MPASDMRTMAHRALRTAREELQKSGVITPMILVQKDGDWECCKLGGKHAQLMNSDHAKAEIFGFLRDYVNKQQATAVIFVTDTWMTTLTEKGKGMSPKEFTALYKKLSREGVVAQGLAVSTEALQVTAHTPDSVLTLCLRYERHREFPITFAPVEEQTVPQSHFAGRQKMFGDLRKENIE